MADKYQSFAALSSVESNDSYAIRLRNNGSGVAIAAPHGGGIEPGTSEIALALAGEDLSYYLFEGQKQKGNGNLHITSSNFDEPQCLELLATAATVITVHGEGSNEAFVFLGGRNIRLVEDIRQSLIKAGFAIGTTANPALQGCDPSNIANRGSERAGVQLEISRGLRERFFTSLLIEGRAQPTPLLLQFANAVRAALPAGTSAPTKVDVPDRKRLS